MSHGCASRNAPTGAGDRAGDANPPADADGSGEGDGGQGSGAEPVDDGEGDGNVPGGSDVPAGPDILDQFPDDDMLNDTPNAEYLGSLKLAHVRAGGQVFLVWLADTSPQRSRGLMFVTDEEMVDLPDERGRGMLFRFESDTSVGFWMRNTITPLDVAYVRDSGVIDSIRTMTPLDETSYPPDGPYLYALEVPAGTFARLGVVAGDTIELPAFSNR